MQITTFRLLYRLSPLQAMRSSDFVVPFVPQWTAVTMSRKNGTYLRKRLIGDPGSHFTHPTGELPVSDRCLQLFQATAKEFRKPFQIWKITTGVNVISVVDSFLNPSSLIYLNATL